MNRANKRKGPIYWLLGLPNSLENVRAASLRRSRESSWYFVTQRTLIPVIALCVAVVVRHFGILPDRLAYWQLMGMLLGAACVFLMTIRDLHQ